MPIRSENLLSLGGIVGVAACLSGITKGSRSAPAVVSQLQWTVKLGSFGRRQRMPPSTRAQAQLFTDAGRIVTDPIDRTVEIIRDQHGAVLQNHHVGWPSKILVIFDEPGEKRID